MNIKLALFLNLILFLQLTRSEPDILTSTIAKKDLRPRDIDTHWLQRNLRVLTSFADPVAAQEMAQKVVDVLKNTADDRDLKNKLVLLLGTQRVSMISTLISTLRKNREMIFW